MKNIARPSNLPMKHRGRPAKIGICLKCRKVGLLCRGYCRRGCYQWALYHSKIKSLRTPKTNCTLLSRSEIAQHPWLTQQVGNFARQHAKYFDYNGQRFLVLSEAQLTDLCRIIYTAKAMHDGGSPEPKWAYYGHNRVRLKSDIEEGDGEYLDRPISRDIKAYRKVCPGI